MYTDIYRQTHTDSMYTDIHRHTQTQTDTDSMYNANTDRHRQTACTQIDTD